MSAPRRVAGVVLSVRVHLDYILVAVPQGVFITDLQAAAIPKIVDPPHNRAAHSDRDLPRVVGGRVVNHQDIRLSRNLQPAQLP